jgi:hypothetical protein
MMASVVEDGEPAFVPVMVASEEEDKRPADGCITIEFGGGVMMRVPGDMRWSWLAGQVGSRVKV